MIYYMPVVISVTFLVAVAAINRIMDHYDRIDLDRLADPTPLPGELVQPPRAGRIDYQGAQDPIYQGYLARFPQEIAEGSYALGRSPGQTHPDYCPGCKGPHRPLRLVIVPGKPRSDEGELSPFPGEGIVTHNELDQYARHYQGLMG